MKHEMIGWQWYQLDYMQIICTSLQTDNHTSNSSLNFLQAGCSSLRQTNNVKTVKAKTACTNERAHHHCSILRSGQDSCADCECVTESQTRWRSECLWSVASCCQEQCTFLSGRHRRYRKHAINTVTIILLLVKKNHSDNVLVKNKYCRGLQML